MPAPPPVMSATLPERRLMRRSFRRGAGRLDHLAPAPDLGADPLREVLRRAGDDLELERLELAAHLRRLCKARDLAVVTLYDRTRCAAGREKTDPCHGLEVREALLDHRRHLGRGRKALAPRGGDGAQLPLLHV